MVVVALVAVLVAGFAAVFAYYLARSQSHRAVADEPLRAGTVRAPADSAEKAAQTLSALIKCETVTRADPAIFTALHAELRRRFPLIHKNLKVTKHCEGNCYLLYTWPGYRPELEPVVLMAHQDVVPGGEKTAWQHPAFGGEIVNGFVWGRGAIDCKGPLATVMHSVEYLLEAGFIPTRTVMMAFGHDEEQAGMRGAKCMAQQFLDAKAKFYAVLDEGSAVLDFPLGNPGTLVAPVPFAEKGFANIRLEAKSTVDSQHSSKIPHGKQALVQISKAIARIESHQQSRTLHFIAQTIEYLPLRPLLKATVQTLSLLCPPLLKLLLSAVPDLDAMMRTTFVVTQVGSDAAEHTNTIPLKAWATVNSRVLPGQTLQDARKHVERVVNDPTIAVTLSPESREPSPQSLSSGRVYDSIGRAIRVVFGSNVYTVPTVLYAGTDSYFYHKLCPHTYNFSPMKFAVKDTTLPHAPNERISVKSLKDMIDWYMIWIQDVSSQV